MPLHNVTVSSDAFGSLPTYDSDGRLMKYTVADARALLRFLRNMYFQVGWAGCEGSLSWHPSAWGALRWLASIHDMGYVLCVQHKGHGVAVGCPSVLKTSGSCI